LNGYEPSIGFIHVDLKPLWSIKILYERKKAIAQSRGKRELYERYVRRERNREKDSINKPSAELRMLFPNTIHAFEDLDKEDMVSRKKRGKNRRKRNARTPWKRIHKRISEVALTAYVDPSSTSRESLDAGMLWKTQEGEILECPRCELKISRHRVASINIRRRHLEGKRRGKRRARMRDSPQQ
jgi:putative transposase